MAGEIRTCEGEKLFTVPLTLLFAVTLMSGIGIGETANCSILLDTYDTSVGVYTNNTVVVPFLAPATHDECETWCTRRCLCVGYVHSTSNLTTIFPASRTETNLNCYAYLTLAGGTIQDANATMYTRKGAPTCSNLPDIYDSSSSVVNTITSSIYVVDSNITTCNNLCSSSCLCMGYSFDVNPFTFSSCLLYRTLSGKTTIESGITLYKRKGLTISAGSGNSIGGISGGFFNLLLIGGGFLLSVYFTG